MKQEYVSEGKTIEDAIVAACEKLEIDRDSVEVEVLETPSKGFLGFGSNNAKVKVIYEESSGAEKKAKEFLEGVFEHMGLKIPNMNMQTEEKELKIELDGEDMGAVIGRRGEVLDALQYLTSLVVNKDKEEEYCRVMLDIENYREKRKKALEELAERVAAKVIKYKRNMTLEPMQAYERRIIHSALQNNKEISTYSIGEEPHRKIVVAFGMQKSGESENRSYGRNNYRSRH